MTRIIQWPDLGLPEHGLPASRPQCRPGVVQQQYRMRLLTPVFTSVVSSQAASDVAGLTYGEPVSAVRVTAIRSQLRFWWRATRGASFETVRDLFNAEAEIWGAPAGVGNDCKLQPVDLSVTVDPNGERDSRRETFERLTRIDVEPHIKQPNSLAYVLWPFALSETGDVPIGGIRELKFSLVLTFAEEHREDVDAAVWAWSSFGGLGVRTRRGCGALSNKASGVLSGAAGQKKVEKWLRQKLEKYGSDVRRPWPTLSNHALLHAEVNAKAEDGPQANWLATARAWMKAVEAMQMFRQGIGVAREPSGRDGKFPGVTRWPEAENIRSQTQRSDKVLAKRPEMPPEYFPRAEFGMPLGFHFILNGDPPAHQAVPVFDSGAKDRMGSPLIVKPLAVAANDSSIYPLICRLNCSTKCDLVSVINDDGTETLTAEMIAPQNAAELKIREMKNSQSGSAVDAFWSWARTVGGFTEIGNSENNSGASE